MGFIVHHDMFGHVACALMCLHVVASMRDACVEHNINVQVSF